MTTACIFFAVLSFGVFGTLNGKNPKADWLWIIVTLIFLALALSRVNFGWPS